MNNKLFARIAAAAVGVSMLSTFVFADGTASLNADKSQLNLNTTAITSATGEGATQVTMMAYLVGADATIETAYADETTTPMVALEQVAKDDVATKLAIINVLPEKFANTSFTQAIIKTGHNGTVSDTTGGVKWLIGTVSTPEGKKITIMNGTTAIDIDVVDGVATLPTDTKFDKTILAGNDFSLYSWVALDADGKQTAEYILSEGTTVNAAALEGVTLYAKYNTGILVGDVDLSGEVDSTDSTYIDFWAFDGDNYLEDTLGKPIYVGSDIIIGDVDLSGEVDSTDSTYIDFWAFDGDNYLEDTLGKKIFLINGTTVSPIYAD